MPEGWWRELYLFYYHGLCFSMLAAILVYYFTVNVCAYLIVLTRVSCWYV